MTENGLRRRHAMIPATLRRQHAQGTTPCTIAQAICLCKGQQQRSSSVAPIDLVAIVVDVILSPFQQSLVWIQDGSLTKNDDDEHDSPHGALFSFSNSAIVQEHQVSIGDVVRFNRVALKGSRKHKNHHSDNKTLFEGSSVLYSFHHPWSDPEAGPEWFCLGHVDGTSGEFQPTQAILPDSMQTDSSYLQRLYHWYLTSSYFQVRQTTTPLLSPLPCQLRSICDLSHSCVGVISHVHARVLDLQHVRPGSSVVFALLTDATASTTTTTTGEGSVFTSESTLSGSMTSRDTILFRDDSGLFRDTLELAHVTQQVLRLTTVMTKRTTSGVRFSTGIKEKGGYLKKHKNKLQTAAVQRINQDQPDIVLLPTAKTCVTIISPNGRAGPKKNCFAHSHEHSLPNQSPGMTWSTTQSNPMLPSKPVTVAHAFVRCLSFQSDESDKVVALTKENIATTCVSGSGQCAVDYASEAIASLSRALENCASSRARTIFQFELQRVEPNTNPSDAVTCVQASISVDSFLHSHLGCNSDELSQSPHLRQIILRVLVGMIWDQAIFCWTLKQEKDDRLPYNQGGLTGRSGSCDSVVITHVSLPHL